MEGGNVPTPIEPPKNKLGKFVSPGEGGEGGPFTVFGGGYDSDEEIDGHNSCTIAPVSMGVGCC